MSGSEYRWLPKARIVSVRLDIYTDKALNELMKVLGTKRRSNIIRLAIWYLIIMSDPKLTVKTLLKKEALEKIMKGEDMSLNEAMKSFNEIAKELGYLVSS